MEKRDIGVLIVDDKLSMRETVSGWLEDRGFRIATAADGRQAIEMARKEPFHVAVVDLKMPGMDGLEVLRRLKEIDPEISVIMMTAYATVETAVQAMKDGAYDYIVKPFNLEEMGLLIEKAVERQRLIEENLRLQRQLEEKYQFDHLIGKSHRMREIFRLIEDVAGSNTTILIQGSSGTGKELVAQTIHYRSLRTEKPFIAINCAALPESLLESELFGYEKGAFTGAYARKTGRFEMADGGTLLLDEVEDMSLATQVDLLRVLQEREFMRLGGRELIRVDVRIIASSKGDLWKYVERGAFRDDLYYRLNVVSIRLPELRERKEDIPLLAEAFLRRYNQDMGKHITKISPEAMDLLMAYDWPGNVRELENAIEHAIVLGKDTAIAPEYLPPTVRGIEDRSLGPVFSTRSSLQEVEKVHVLNVLKETGWNRTQAARILGIDRTTLLAKIRKYALEEG